MSLALIGAGFGRTGTLSLKGALEKIGFGPCYHMMEVFQTPAHPALWAAAVDGKPTDWDVIFAGYRATVDWPGCHFWRELAARHPDAPVLLSVRDPERWYESVRNTIYKVMTADVPEQAPDPMKTQMRMVRKMVLEQTFGGRFEDRAHAIGVFERHSETVRREIPAERLLVYEVGSGWEPLCAFLGRPVPEEPFPRTNTSEDFQQRIHQMREQAGGA